MIRFINCVRKRSDISSEQFRQYWNDPKLDAIIDRVVEYTGATGRAKNLTLLVAANDLMQERRAYGEPFDGGWNTGGSMRRGSTPCSIRRSAMC